MKAKVNLLSVDLEDWHHSAYLKDFVKSVNIEHRIEESTDNILEVFKRHNVTATFFVLGAVAESHPLLIKKIFDDGHEIASHGYSHTPLYRHTPKSFHDEITKTNDILKQITKKKPKGYRAPYASLNYKTAWAIKIIEAEFMYDSSIFPMRTPMYGVKNAPLGIYKMNENNFLQHDENAKLIEIPFTVYRNPVLSIPCTGGIYIRFMPFLFVNFLFQRIQKIRPVNFYFHPWETDSNIPRIKVPIKNKIISYYNVNNYLKKIERLLKYYKFYNFEQFLTLKGYLVD